MKEEERQAGSLRSGFDDENTWAGSPRSDSVWNRVYAAVIVTTFVVVTALYAFSQYFR